LLWISCVYVENVVKVYCILLASHCWEPHVPLFYHPPLTPMFPMFLISCDTFFTMVINHLIP
jgi:hypothetical protein